MKTDKEIFDKRYEFYRNMENKPLIPLEARELIFAVMQEYAEAYHESKMAEITDEDIEKWVDDEIKKEPMLGYSRAMMIYSAKAFKNGEIKHT